MTKLSIVIPIFNEARTAAQLLDMVGSQKIANATTELIIVESNSTDGTRDIATAFARRMNEQRPGVVKIVLQDVAKGKGNAVREGLKHATGDIILIQDGDLEYDVKDYGQLIAPIIEGRGDVVLGSRHLAAGNWKIRKFGRNQLRSRVLNLGGVFFHGLFNIVYGQRLTDPTTMYKVFKRSCLDDFDLEANRFDFDFELLGKLIRSGHQPIEVPVVYSSRGFEEGKKIRVLKDPPMWVWAILKYRFCRLKGDERPSASR